MKRKTKGRPNHTRELATGRSIGQCAYTGKFAYESERAVRTAAKEARLHPTAGMTAKHFYQCPYCHFWHTTHQPQRRDQ